MATALTPGFIYLIESETGVDDWITDHSGDPDLIDLDNFSVGNNSEEGKGYCKLKIPRNIQKAFDTGRIVTDLIGGVSVDQRWQRRAYGMNLNGIEASIAEADLIGEFFMSNRHTAGSTSTFKQYYLIIYFGVNTHIKFTDHNGNRQSYCKGVVLKGSIIWNMGESLRYSLKLNFRSTWS